MLNIRIQGVCIRTFNFASFFKTLSWKWISNKLHQFLYTVHRITDEAVKLISASIRRRIYFL